MNLRVQLFALQALLQEIEESQSSDAWLTSNEVLPPALKSKREIVRAAHAELQYAAGADKKPSATALLKLSEGLDAALLKDADYGRFSGLLSAVRSVRVASEIAFATVPPPSGRPLPG